jgi:hypothetical protein
VQLTMTLFQYDPANNATAGSFVGDVVQSKTLFASGRLLVFTFVPGDLTIDTLVSRWGYLVVLWGYTYMRTSLFHAYFACPFMPLSPAPLMPLSLAP